MKDLIEALNKLPKIVKIILCLPVLDIVWSVWRLLNALTAKKVNWVMVLVAALTIFPGAAIMWLVDFIWVLMYDSPIWFKD